MNPIFNQFRHKRCPHRLDMGDKCPPPERYYFSSKHFEKKLSLKNMPKIMRSEETFVPHIKTGLGLRNFHFGKHFQNGHQGY